MQTRFLGFLSVYLSVSLCLYLRFSLSISPFPFCLLPSFLFISIHFTLRIPRSIPLTHTATHHRSLSLPLQEPSRHLVINQVTRMDYQYLRESERINQQPNTSIRYHTPRTTAQCWTVEHSTALECPGAIPDRSRTGLCTGRHEEKCLPLITIATSIPVSLSNDAARPRTERSQNLSPEGPFSLNANAPVSKHHEA